MHKELRLVIELWLKLSLYLKLIIHYGYKDSTDKVIYLGTSSSSLLSVLSLIQGMHEELTYR